MGLPRDMLSATTAPPPRFQGFGETIDARESGFERSDTCTVALGVREPRDQVSFDTDEEAHASMWSGPRHCSTTEVGSELELHTDIQGWLQSFKSSTTGLENNII